MAETIWRSARELIKLEKHNYRRLPDRPEWLSEPAYANLVFGISCHVRIFFLRTLNALNKHLFPISHGQNCSRKIEANYVAWAHGARYCRSCYRKKLKRVDGRLTQISDLVSQVLDPPFNADKSFLAIIPKLIVNYNSYGQQDLPISCLP